MSEILSLDQIPQIASYLTRIGAEARNIKTAVVKEVVGNTGYWRDIAVIKFNTENGEVVAPFSYAPTEEEAKEIRTAILSTNFPKPRLITSFDKLPDELIESDEKDLFFFKTPDGRTSFIQQRVKTKTGKIYVPWSLYDDNVWRKCEPFEKLPLFGLDSIKDNSRVFVHEGAKSAKFLNNLLSNPKELEKFPWADDVKNAAHVAFVGGALATERTDWTPLQNPAIQVVYIVSDNDEIGLESAPKIAKHLNCLTYNVRFSNDFPRSFDLADEFPSEMFETIGDNKYYIGPSFVDCVTPATYMTNKVWEVVEGKKNPQARVYLRKHAANSWVYVHELEHFVHRYLPNLQYDAETLNKVLKPFSDTNNVSDLLFSNYDGAIRSICYRPDNPKRIINNNGKLSFNLYQPSSIKSQKGDASPFLEYLSYLIPDKDECYKLQRWCATLIAKPEIRMLYSVLMISQQTGVGKTMLAEKILAPLVGHHNCSFPNENTILEKYTSWVGAKRLAVVNEIYQGNSFAAVNKLKSIITDNVITHRLMFQNEINIDNFLVIFACSNSLNALAIDGNDRRWMIPTVTEERWSDKQFSDFYDWLKCGGLSIVKYWAENFGDYVRSYEKAPTTNRKMEMIDSSLPHEYKKILEVTNNNQDVPIVIGIDSFIDILRTSDKVFKKPIEIRKRFVENGWKDSPMIGMKQIWKDKRNQYFVMNQLAFNILVDSDDKKRDIELFWKNPNEVM